MTSPKTYATLRVSSDSQDLQKNRADILRLADEKRLGQVHWVEETASGRGSWKKCRIGLGIGDWGLGIRGRQGDLTDRG